MNIPAVKLSNVSKKYYLERPKTLKKYFKNFFSPFQKFTVIKNLSFTVDKGDFVVILGANGSGKTTLLKLISGITLPDKGTITTVGKVVPLIELGAGFNYELTGKENILINAAILGIERSTIQKSMQNIIKFSGLRRFINIPLKRYSSGMLSRLAFSIGIHSSPDILLLDEIFAVGDKSFREKSSRVLAELRQKKITIILTAHDKVNYLIKPDKIIKISSNKSFSTI